MFHLKDIRIENGLTRAELSRLLKINQGTLANYENETREASYELLCLFADYFDVTVDDLLGRQDNEKTGNLRSPLTAEEKETVSRIRQLSGDKRKLLRDFLRLLEEV